jgi:hypothetical protein
LRTICPSWLQTMILLITASWVARITGVSHWHLGRIYFFRCLLSCFSPHQTPENLFTIHEPRVIGLWLEVSLWIFSYQWWTIYTPACKSLVMQCWVYIILRESEVTLPPACLGYSQFKCSFFLPEQVLASKSVKNGLFRHKPGLLWHPAYSCQSEKCSTRNP